MVTHASQDGISSPEESPLFDLIAVPTGAGAQVTLVESVGMFAHPQVSPVRESDYGDRAYQVAYLQALLPTQSRASGYRPMGDGSGWLQPQSIIPAGRRPGDDTKHLCLVSAWSG